MKLKPLKCKAYVLPWSDGVLGRVIAPYLYDCRSPCKVYVDKVGPSIEGEWSYLCEMAIEPVMVDGKYERRKVK